MPSVHKFVSGPATVLGDRQVRVRCSSGAVDRMGDVIVQSGIQYDTSIAVLWSHDPEKIVGRATPQMISGELYALIDFAPAGISKHADEICGLTKAGTITGCSIGFNPLERPTPIDPKNPSGGVRYSKIELVELSMVSVPANSDAEVVGRSRKSGRVLSSVNRDKLQSAHDLIDQGRGMVADMLAATEPPAPDPGDLGAADPYKGNLRTMTKTQRIARAKALGLALPPPLTSVERGAHAGPPVPATREGRIARAQALAASSHSCPPELVPIFRTADEMGISMTTERARRIVLEAKELGRTPAAHTRYIAVRLGTG